MAKVKIQGHASGTGVLTVTAPNTSTDRTLTLPDSTDTLAVNSDVTNKLPLAGGTVTGTLYATHTGGIEVNSTSHAYLRVNSSASSTASWINFKQGGTARWLAGVEGSDTGWQLYDNAGGSTVLKVTQDGRGLSQFTAKCWVYFDGTGTAAIQDSHNVSTLDDSGAGDYRINFTNNLANVNYSITAMGNYAQGSSKAPIIHQRGGKLVSSFELRCIEANTAYTNMDTGVCATVFGD